MIGLSICLMPAGQILFALPKKYPKTLVQKKAIAEHRSFSNQNAFSTAHGDVIILIF
jgi:hypothetical protein